ncbi:MULTISPECIES: cytochrome c oxidase assembly protein [unclassified Microbacterium]|uniref:cytochrome c oxidase assembly protein n=1 Tax=unclassified Microbacterium TaxID=2609290 RepID=UPI00214AEC59|nr:MULTISPECIES: cytochrome c oxidase assembly protein [unclassified Microbacterium]MCR2808699.1 cytochrome c oxidase assembly protein [Microbacterium sp. zg.B185]WIM18869.1 cytochrome c oxidase assembly protein [Microbacterium sp. zg-B185]
MHHGSSASLNPDLLLAVPIVLAAAMYLGGAWIQWQRARPWPWWRTAAWLAGVLAAAAGFVGPLAAAAHDDFVAHMGVHLLVGMVAPLLLVIAAPVTLALRSLHVTPARRLVRLLSSRPARVACALPLAAVLNIGGMWVLYTTDLAALIHQNPLAQVAMSAHFLLAGYLFTAAVIPMDPAPHRAAYPVRAGVLMLFLAAHSILAKVIYADPPSGVDAAVAQSAAQLMYYAGGVVDAVMLTVLCALWYRDTGRRLDRAARGPWGRFRSDYRRTAPESSPS